MPYTNITLSQLQGFVLNRLQNGEFYPTQTITDAINETLRLFQVSTGYWTDRYVITTVATRVIYATGIVKDADNVAQILMPVRMAFNSLPLEPTSIHDMDCGFANWQFTTTATTGAESTPILWGPMGLNYFFIYPADAAGSNSLQIDAIKRAPVLVNDTDYLDIESSLVPPLLDYIQHILSFARGGVAFQSAMALFQNFFKACGNKNEHLKVLEPFRSFMGEDSSRRMRPRRAKDFTGRKETIGVRS